MTKIVLMGDSTLDNEHWVEEGMSVTEQLRRIKPGDTIINLAVDGFTTSDILNGAYRDKAVSSVNHQHKMSFPLKQLKKIKKCDHIVLSVGGNDFREELQSLIYQSPSQRVDSIKSLSESISKNYLEIIKQIKTTKPHAKLTILLQYTPTTKDDIYKIYFLMSAIAKEKNFSNTSSAYLSFVWHFIAGLNNQESKDAVEALHDIMEKVYQPLFKKLMDKDVSVIDLASSFNPKDKSLYVSQIEPSERGANLIANLIFDATRVRTTKSQLFSKPCQLVNGETHIISLEEVKDHWRPGHVYSNENDAKKAFVDAYNDSSPQPKSILKMFDAKSINSISGKSLTTLVEESLNGQASVKSTEIMQRLNFLDHNAHFTEKSAVSKLITPSAPVLANK